TRTRRPPPARARSRSTRSRASQAAARRRRARAGDRLARSRRARPLAGDAQLLLQRVPVDAVVVAPQLVPQVVDLVDRAAGDDPARCRFAAPPVELACVLLGEALVGCRERARMLEGLTLPLLAEDLEDGHAASARTTSRTQAVCSRVSRRSSSRSWVFGP